VEVLASVGADMGLVLEPRRSAQ